MTEDLSKHSRIALARIYVDSLGGPDLQIDGRSVTPLRKRGLIEFRAGRRSVGGRTSFYRLTTSGLARCSEADVVAEARVQARAEAQRAERAYEKAKREVARQAKAYDALVEVVGALDG